MQRTDLSNKKVLIMGLGTKGGGVGSCIYAYNQGAIVTVTDLQPEDKLIDSIKEITHCKPKLVLGQHRLKDFAENDIIIKNPGIRNTNPFLQKALETGKTVTTPIGIFSEQVNTPYIGITGTKGKSYTTHLTNHILKGLGVKSVAAGNNCVSPLQFLNKDYSFVLELSSWQLHEMARYKKSPQIACWLNFFPDHLNFYNNMDEYFVDKSRIFQFQKEDDIAILPLHNKEISSAVKAAKPVYFSSTTESTVNLPDGCYIRKNKLLLKDEGLKILELPEKIWKEINIAEHHKELLTAALCMSYQYLKQYNSLVKFTRSGITEILRNWPGIDHRFEFFYENNGVKYINDSAASTPDSVIKALETLKKKSKILIAGGGGAKNLNHTKLAEYIIRHKIHVVLFKNDNTSTNIEACFIKEKYKNYAKALNMPEAVQIAKEKACQDATDYIILSPACSGAPFYTDMFERGREFKMVVKENLPAQNQ